MEQPHPTYFASLEKWQKGHAEIISGDVKHYVFSNMFDVASRSRPYEKVVVGKNLEYVLEALRAEGASPWFACGHDEFAVCMDGEIEVEFVKLDAPAAGPDKNGAVLVKGEPKGRKMGRVRLRRGHQALLPAGSAYRFSAAKKGVLMLQTILGDLSVQKWAEICEK
ncbi:MAG TPA: hydroxyquinol 1,2-dioxygenase [Burkholderiales bacterium]|nr:hydroxyquinol 1,2-dioxygenase [Burkholderiales bacterium]